jgi:putative protease
MSIKMKTPEILAPINAVEEVEPLLKAGATWLYGGVLPSDWKEKYPSTVLLNQRTFPSAQFSSLEALESAVQAAHNRGGRLALTLNAPFYMDEQMAAVLDLLRWAEKIQIDAIIAADPGLMAAMGREGISIPVHLSTMGLASNVSAVKMYQRLGVGRIILPRFLSAAQIGDMVTGVPDMEYEAFVLIGKCPNIEGVCSFVHDSSDQRWPCEWNWELEGKDPTVSHAPVSKHYKDLAGTDRRDGCGLCALPLLASVGVSSFKIVGRGAPLARKVQLVTSLHGLLTSMPLSPGPALPGSPGWTEWPGWLEWVARCREEYLAIFGHHCTPHNCYYPEIDGIW